MTHYTETDEPNIPGAGAASDAPMGAPEEVPAARPSDLVKDTLPGDDETLGTPAANGQGDAPEEEQLLEALKDVVDPELGINVVDLGLIYGVHIDDDSSVTVDMTLTSAACPLTDVIEAQTETALDGLATRTTINWVWMPPWTPEKITDDGREQLRALGFNV